jgi:hypothetical protein
MIKAFSPLLEFTQLMLWVTKSAVLGGKICPVAGCIVSVTNFGTAASKTKFVMGTFKPQFIRRTHKNHTKPKIEIITF